MDACCSTFDIFETTIRSVLERHEVALRRVKVEVATVSNRYPDDLPSDLNDKRLRHNNLNLCRAPLVRSGLDKAEVTLLRVAYPARSGVV